MAALTAMTMVSRVYTVPSCHNVRDTVSSIRVGKSAILSSRVVRTIPAGLKRNSSAHCLQASRSQRSARVVVRANSKREAPSAEDQVVLLAKLDGLIDSLLGASEEEFPSLVGQNVMNLNQQFFLRLATRSDSCQDEELKGHLSVLATTVMNMLESIVNATKSSMSESSEILQSICSAAADPVTGEFEVPLAPDKVAAMRNVVKMYANQMDESTVAHCYAWIRKANEDKMDGMVVILQRVLQLYAAYALVKDAKPTAEENTVRRALEEVLAADVEQWNALLDKAQADGYGDGAFMNELHRNMEQIVMGMSNGSYSQRVLAEYLKEVEELAKGKWETAK